MKRKTKNFFEDALIVIAILLVIYLIYFFVFSSNQSDTKVEIVSSNSNPTSISVEDRDNFFENLYLELKDKIFGQKLNSVNQEEDKSNIEKTEEKEQQLNLEQNYLKSSREDILQKHEERVQNSSETNNHIVLDENKKDIEEITPLVVEKVEQEKQKDPISLPIETKEEIKPQLKEASKEELKVEHKEVLIVDTTEPFDNSSSSNTLAKPMEDIKTDENSEEHIESLKNIDLLFQNFEKKVYSNIEKNVDKSTLRQGQFVNIRVTILKNGSFEQLSFISGNSGYFNLIRNSIEKAFPLEIDKSLVDQFPRYYRMKIDF